MRRCRFSSWRHFGYSVRLLWFGHVRKAWGLAQNRYKAHTFHLAFCLLCVWWYNFRLRTSGLGTCWNFLSHWIVSCIMSAGRAKRQIFRLHLGNLSPTISIDDIESRFRRFGEVQEVNILLDKFPMEGRQYNAQFRYVSLYAASAAIEQCRTTFNGCNWKGRKLRVKYAKPDLRHSVSRSSTKTVSR